MLACTAAGEEAIHVARYAKLTTFLVPALTRRTSANKTIDEASEAMTPYLLKSPFAYAASWTFKNTVDKARETA